MHIRKIFGFLAVLFIAGCAQSTKTDWYAEYGTMDTGTPTNMLYGTLDSTVGTPSDNFIGAPTHRMAVMLPLTGDNAQTGRAIQTSIEMAVLENAPQNLSVAFYDTANNINDSIDAVISDNPEIVIGPIFAADARTMRDSKPESMPVLSFTSDATALGDGVMTMALMPTNSTEAIVKQMASDGITGMIMLAPDTTSGHLMAGTAQYAAKIYDIPVTGIFFYAEKDSESIKTATAAASMNTARVAANTRAREILSDILTQERLTAIEKSSLTLQLEKLSKTDTLGKLPYDAVLFLGDGDDTETLASFLRYYGVSARDARFYGTALWDGSDITRDITMIGAKYAALPETSPEFANLYNNMSGEFPNRLAGFGYDAANMAIGMIYSQKSDAAYLLDPSGYVGVDGLFRLKPTGENERALRIVQLTGDGSVKTLRNAPTDFITPVYNIEQRKISPADEMELETPGINPNEYINIPPRLHDKYKSDTYGAHITIAPTPMQQSEPILILPEDDRDLVITTPDFQPVNLETINRTYIDSIEITEY